MALAVSLLFFYGRSAESQLVATVEHDNIVLATAMGNEFVEAFPKHFQVPHTSGTVNDAQRGVLIRIRCSKIWFIPRRVKVT